MECGYVTNTPRKSPGRGARTRSAAAERAERKRKVLKDHIRRLQDRLDVIERALRTHLLQSGGQTSLDEFGRIEEEVAKRK